MRKTEFVGVRLTVRERKLLRSGAAALGRKEADFIRVAAVQTAQRLLDRPKRVASAVTQARQTAAEVLAP